jgi:Erv1 / Alr family
MIFRPFFAQQNTPVDSTTPKNIASTPPPPPLPSHPVSPPVIQKSVTFPPEPTHSFLGFSRKTKYTSLPVLVVNSNRPPTYTPLATPKQTIKQITTNPNKPDDKRKKMIWGEPTWFLLHTLAEKVIDEKFQEVRKGLLDIIYTIATNLPCPNCSVHAKGYLDGVNFNSIQTKEQLKLMLFDFHNFVNKRKQFEVYQLNDLSSKYSAAITKNIIQNFMTHFEQKSKSIRLIADDLHRQRITVNLKEWFNNNITYFYP